jgi:hypothetical protein
MKLGKEVEGAVEVQEDAILEHDGPDDLDELFNKGRRYRYYKAVHIGQARVFTTRPIFPEWKITFAMSLDQNKNLNWDIVMEILREGGTKGLCERRPRYGRFVVVE